ncbi:MAG: putative MPP superfamily phosphohydrolase [Rickettsiales bacterium]|jgi:predicted MPP superfamily phosphohydrolase
MNFYQISAQSIFFYASYLSIQILVVLIFLAIVKRRALCGNKILMAVYALSISATLLFIYSRFIERNLITQQVTRINTGFEAKIIVISDIHLGVYKDTNFLKSVVKKINKIKNADAVLIAGDFTYHSGKNLESLFYPLKDIKFPVYAVLGNHDSDKTLQKELQATLENNNVVFLHNSSFPLKENITILGLGDKWTNEDMVSKIDQFKESDDLIVLTHNPDTVLKYKNNIADLTIAGHTHGGQIRIPFLYKLIIPCEGDFDQGLYSINQNQVFVTSGVGEVGLPMRLGVPPVIDVLELY